MKEVLLGIGNTLKGDDGIGIYIAQKLNQYLKAAKKESKQAGVTETRRKVIVIDCGTTPENYTAIIRKYSPDTLILVDAADMGLSPGSYRIIPPEKIEVMHFSTHNIPLSILISYVSESCGEVVLIGIQPDRMDIGTTLSSVVQKNGDHVVKLMIEGRLDEIKPLET
jgi:hydrogenase 3 maturation protease